MEEIQRKIRMMSKIKWMGLPLGIVMYSFTATAFGNTGASLLGAVFAGIFVFLCENGKKTLICDSIAEHLHKKVEDIGQESCVIDIKVMNPGMVIRVYLIQAGEKAAGCSKAIIDAIAGSWYRPNVWLTQIVDLNNEGELKEAEMHFNEELVKDIKKMKEQRKR